MDSQCKALYHVGGDSVEGISKVIVDTIFRTHNPPFKIVLPRHITFWVV